MAHPQKEPLRALSEQEERELKRLVRATSERVDVVRRAKVILAIASGQSFTEAAQEVGLKSGDGVGKLVKRFNAHGLSALWIAAGAGRKPTYTSEQRARILVEVQREPDRKEDQTATWSLMTLRKALRETDLPDIAAETIREVLHAVGYRYLRTRTWVRTGYALRVRKSGTVTTYDQETRGVKRLIEQAYEQAEAAGIVQLCEDEAGPYQAIPQPGAKFAARGSSRAASARVRARGHRQTADALSPGYRQDPRQGGGLGDQCGAASLAETRNSARCWLRSSRSTRQRACRQKQSVHGMPSGKRGWAIRRGRATPPLRIVLVLDNLAGHLSYDLVGWFFEHGVMPLYTPVGGSWLNMAESGEPHHRAAGAGRSASQERPADHRLVGTNRGRLERPSHVLCVEWQAEEASRARSLTPPGWLRRGSRQGLRHCQLTH
jgi:transposase